MRKKITWLILFLVVLFGLRVLYAWFQTETAYFVDGNAELDNPMRGFYVQVSTEETGRAAELAQDGYRLMLLAMDLEDFSDGEISQKALDDLETCLQQAEAHHIGVIFRAAYNFWGDCAEPEQIELFRTHIAQMAQVLNPHADNLYSVQAGLLGPYGEWHSGAYLTGDEQNDRQMRLYILSAWEEYLDPSVQVDVRRPRFIREAEAAGVLVGRLGFHDDGLLGSDSDLGTYDDPEMDRQAELDWMQAHLLSRGSGGEMPYVSPWSAPEAADAAFRQMHLTYLNRMYNTEVIDGWKAEQLQARSAKEVIEQRLGYRLLLSEATSNCFVMDGRARLMLTLRNDGYGALPEGYQLYLAVRSRAADGTVSETAYTPLPAALEGFCNGEQVQIQGEARLFGGDGVVEVGLKLAKDAQEPDGEDCVILSNAELSYHDTVNWLYTYQKTLYGYRLEAYRPS